MSAEILTRDSISDLIAERYEQRAQRTFTQVAEEFMRDQLDFEQGISFPARQQNRQEAHLLIWRWMLARSDVPQSEYRPRLREPWIPMST